MLRLPLAVVSALLAMMLVAASSYALPEVPHAHQRYSHKEEYRLAQRKF